MRGGFYKDIVYFINEGFVLRVVLVVSFVDLIIYLVIKEMSIKWVY